MDMHIWCAYNMRYIREIHIEEYIMLDFWSFEHLEKKIKTWNMFFEIDWFDTLVLIERNCTDVYFVKKNI